jgi:hypothetical protein
LFPAYYSSLLQLLVVFVNFPYQPLLF